MPARLRQRWRNETTGRGAFSVIAVQASAIALPVLGMMFWDPLWSRSILLGGMAVLVPNAFFAWASTRRKPGGWLLVQGVVKFFLSVLLMVIAFRSFSPHPESFFTGVIAALLAHAIGGFWLQGPAALQAPPRQEAPRRAVTATNQATAQEDDGRRN